MTRFTATFTATKNNVILIGMPGAGKSTVGVLLAKRLGYDFVDTDLLIQVHQGEFLQETLDARGYLELRDIEEQVLLSLDITRTVVATGGSAVYSNRAMAKLGDSGVLVYLAAELDELKRRIDDYATRGIARRPDQNFEDLFAERTKLYSRHTQITVNAAQQPDQVVTEIENALRRQPNQVPVT
ncbi:MAG: shikimate kinase [Pseudomonadales bacterium]